MEPYRPTPDEIETATSEHWTYVMDEREPFRDRLEAIMGAPLAKADKRLMLRALKRRWGSPAIGSVDPFYHPRRDLRHKYKPKYRH